MSKLKLSPWWSGKIKPAREGVYVRDWSHKGLVGDYYAYFDGDKWFESILESPNEAIKCNYPAISQDGNRWRGIVK